MTLSVAAYAINQAVGTPQAAQRVALQEIEVWKQMGLLNPEVQFEGEANRIVEINEHKGSKSWYDLTVFFDGDQEGAPMYIQFRQFPGYVSLMVGTGHAVG